MFIKYIFDFINNPFTIFINDIGDKFEDICEGRKGINAVKLNDNMVPIVRTTTVYSKSAFEFTPIFNNLVNSIKRISKIDDIDFNNGLVELYDSTYRKMGFHSDQSLDLVDNSYICICSFYDNINPLCYRKLVIKNKLSKEVNEIILEPNSFVIFPTETNKIYLHKIILNNINSNLLWLGITFRLSKTFINFINGTPFINNNIILRLADNKESEEFRKLKGMENQHIEWIYPNIDYTISPSDLMVPSNHHY